MEVKDKTISTLCLSIVGLIVIGASLKAPIMKPIDNVLNRGSENISNLVSKLPGGK